MHKVEDPFEIVLVEEEHAPFEALTRSTIAPATEPPALPSAVTARFHGFDLDERPLVVGVAGLPHEILPARTTIALLRTQIGSSVVLLFENGDVRRPIVVGVLQEPGREVAESATKQSLVSVQADDDRLVVSAEREIVVRCGEASITLTRAGKVLIKGTYVLSRSSGYNKIKGATIDIN